MFRLASKRHAHLYVVPVLALLIAGITASTSFGLMGALDSYQPALSFGEIDAAADAAVPPASLTAARTARRVVLVVVDGLRADTAEALPYLAELRMNGYAGRLTVGQPSYSKPGYSAIATGATQEINGVVLNSHIGLTPAETIFAVAGQAGLTTSAIADDWWGEISGNAVTFPHYYADATFNDADTDDKVTAATIASLSDDRADLALVHFAATDTQAHYSGGAASVEYLAAAARIDGFIRDIASHLDLTQDAIIVTADHGHLSRNLGHGSGHGGWETEVVTVPLMAAGAGISHGTLAAPTPAVNLTPTVAALLGLPAPAASEGRIMFPMLSASGEPQAQLAVAQAKRLDILAGAYRGMFGAPAATADAGLNDAVSALESGDFATALDRAEASVTANIDSMATARAAAVAHARSGRIPIAISELLVIGAVLYGAILLAGRTRRVLPLVCGAAFLALDFAIYRGLMHGTYSLGALSGSDIGSMLRLFGLPAFASALLLVVVALILERPATRVERVSLVESVLTGCVGAGLLVAVYGLWANGTQFQPLLPDFRIAFVTLTYMLKATFLAALFIIVPAVAAIWPARRTAAPTGD